MDITGYNRTEGTGGGLRQEKIVVLGCGNLLAGDDGVGIEVLRRLEDEGVPPGVALVEAGAPGLGLLDFMVGAEKVVIVDAVAGGGPPGEVVRWREDEVPALRGRALTVHDVGIREALAWGRRAAPEAMPREVVVVGIRVAGTEAWHMGLSPAVAAAVPAAARRVRAEIERQPGAS
ncbi:MAG: hydrogenase maturation protease [Desulfotomaculales bacterium]